MGWLLPSRRTITIPVVYGMDLVALDEGLPSPSARKPMVLAERLLKLGTPIRWIAPEAVGIDALKAVHDATMVDEILACKRKNGFGTISPRIARTLPYTSGAMLQACRLATADVPAVALVSGFHHASYDCAQMFCTFNGLLVAAVQLLRSSEKKRIAILDADYHYGNGTDDILDRLALRDQIWHYSFGLTYQNPEHAAAYIRKARELETSLRAFNPDLIIYQAGADVHRDDPLGGVLTDREIKQREVIVFTIARDLQVPLAWNLAGGYRVEHDGDMTPVITTHLLAFAAAREVYAQPS